MDNSTTHTNKHGILRILIGKKVSMDKEQINREQNESIKEFLKEVEGASIERWCDEYNVFLLTQHWIAREGDKGTLVSRDMSWLGYILEEKMEELQSIC